MADQPVATVEEVLRAELAQGDAVLVTARPILRHLLSHDDHAMFNDEVIARVRGMIHDVVHQLLFATADAAGLRDRTQLVAELRDPLAGVLFEDADFLAHAHAITLEAQLADRLQRRSGIDPVLTSLLQDQAASRDPVLAGLSMSVIAAQARHVQHCRRMELPLRELPGELFHRALLTLRTIGEVLPDAAAAAETALRAQYDEAAGRLGLLGRLVAAMGRQAPRALEISHAGLAVFTTALAMASRQPRALAVLALGEHQFARLALALRAGGLRPEEVEAQFRFLHPDVTLPDDFGALRVDTAADLLAGSSALAAG